MCSSRRRRHHHLGTLSCHQDGSGSLDIIKIISELHCVIHIMILYLVQQETTVIITNITIKNIHKIENHVNKDSDV